MSISAVQGAFGLNFETIVSDFVNMTGGALTKGYVGIIDVYGTSTGADVGASDGPTSPFGRMIAANASGDAAREINQGFFGVLLDDALADGATGTWLLQGYAAEVQTFVSTADDAFATLWPGDPVSEYPSYSIHETAGNVGSLGLRDAQGAAVDARRRGIFRSDGKVAYAANTAQLLSGLFLGLPGTSFGFYSAP